MQINVHQLDIIGKLFQEWRVLLESAPLNYVTMRLQNVRRRGSAAACPLTAGGKRAKSRFMVDRNARNEMALAIESFMGGKLTAFQFDEVLFEIATATTDKTVQEIRHVLWCFYDDGKDHQVVATTAEWDCFNRLILRLKSDGEIEVAGKKRSWTIRQFIAVLALIAFLAVVKQTGWGEHLFIYAMPFGVISMLLAAWNKERQRKCLQMQTPITPFPSVASLRAIRRQVTDFSKRRYPLGISDRQIRSPLMSQILWIQCGILGLMFAPIPLLLQALPETESDVRIKNSPAVSVSW